MALHQIVGAHLFTLVQPVGFLLGQRTAQKVARAIKTQDCQTALFGSTARWGEMVKQELLAQNGVNGFGQRGAFARAVIETIEEELYG